VDETRPITYEAHGPPLKTILDKMLRPAGLSYRVVEGKILVMSRKLGRLDSGEALAKKIHANFSETSLENVIRLLAEAARTDIVLAKEVANQKEQLVTFAINDACLRDVLSQVLKPFGLTYRIRDEQIQIVLTREDPNVALERPVSCAFEAIELRAGLNLLCDPQLVEIIVVPDVTNMPVSYQAQDVPLKNALEQMLPPLELTYRVEDNAIWIVPLRPAPQSLLDKRIGVAFPDVRLYEALRFVGVTANVEFAVADGIDQYVRVRSESSEELLKDGLTKMLEPHRLTYKVEKDRIRIVPIAKNKQDQ
jgi:type II secretory pathway component GspD/PulD (secretin)